MKPAPNPEIERLRLSGPANTNYGAFGIKYKGSRLRIIASEGTGWDHVSISLEHRPPTWEEMELVKQLFFKPEEWAVQYHPAKANYVNKHPNCLHIWRPQTKEEADRIKAEWVTSGESLPPVWDQPGPLPIPPEICV